MSVDVLYVIWLTLFVPSVRYWKWKSWRLLVKERIAKIAKLRTHFFGRLQPLYWFLIFIWALGSVLVSQATVHSGGVIRGMVCACWRW